MLLLLLELIVYFISAHIAAKYSGEIWHNFNKAVVQPSYVSKAILYADIINSSAVAMEISPVLIASVIKAESSFSPDAKSGAGAYGLMQVMPDTWREVNNELKLCLKRHKGECSTDCFAKPELNIYIGTKYLSRLYKKYNNMVLALAAYNAGGGAVDRMHGIPPYSETAEYLEKVIYYWYDYADKSKDYQTQIAEPKQAAVKWRCIAEIAKYLMLATLWLALWLGWRLKKQNKAWRWR